MAMSDESYSIAFSAALIVNDKTSVMITLSLYSHLETTFFHSAVINFQLFCLW